IFNRFSNFALENIPLFAGFTDYKNSDEMYNSIMLFKKDGFEKYDKVRLVPFGEYIPFKDLFFFIDKITDEISDFTPGEKIHNLTLRGKKISTPICYEIIYPEIVRDFINLGGNAIILISNDSWYGTTAAPYHLLSMSVFRSIENRRYILRSTSNGISAVIDPRGEIIKSVPLNKEQSFTSDFSFREKLTFFTRIGYLFPYAIAILTFVFLLLSLRRKD
ncbi:MAG: apolipoprotein N-acyltransferase, partial [Candidatus Aminicenantes bacterium]|nr:apolipoprotein N-acyltransferase [Candidatus Aminicenantes bacterium]